jgi:hypothetical protein
LKFQPSIFAESKTPIGPLFNEKRMDQQWLLYQTKDSSIHYYNTNTKESTWKKPQDYNDEKVIYGQTIRTIISKF